ncbi:MAG: hypothetical protein AAFN30_19585, partial [Actinomycetota bacterium]
VPLKAVCRSMQKIFHRKAWICALSLLLVLAAVCPLPTPVSRRDGAQAARTNSNESAQIHAFR